MTFFFCSPSPPHQHEKQKAFMTFDSTGLPLAAGRRRCRSQPPMAPDGDGASLGEHAGLLEGGLNRWP